MSMPRVYDPCFSLQTRDDGAQCEEDEKLSCMQRGGWHWVWSFVLAAAAIGVAEAGRVWSFALGAAAIGVAEAGRSSLVQ